MDVDHAIWKFSQSAQGKIRLESDDLMTHGTIGYFLCCFLTAWFTADGVLENGVLN